MSLLRASRRALGPLRLLTRHQSTNTAVKENSSSILSAVTQLGVGDNIHGYTVQKVASIPEFEIATVELTHNKTGAKHFHVAKEDANNTFSVALRTTPLDSTGIPHILEHTVLCGSRNFPVRDPFFNMLNRSMATFMNAFTGYDWTMYPFSTMNKQDFYNLLSVYLDAVFHPKLTYRDFSQEGWRLEHEDLNDQNSPIVFKGVVFNEMKGVFSNPQSGYVTEMMNKLLPSHTYSVCSGGDPAHIPDLTWEQLRAFHATHYHPSNARFFTYGDFPLEGHLEHIDSSVLSHFQRLDVDTTVPDEKRWTQPRAFTMTCRPDPMAADQNKQTTVAFSYLLGRITDEYESFLASVIGSLLTSGETSPFYRSLIEANIGSDYSPVLGYDGHTKEGTFSVGLQGVRVTDVDHVKQIIRDTIDKVIKEGIPRRNIDALLHRIELGMKHQTTKFGLGLSIGLASLWNHDGDPISHLQVSDRVCRFKQDLADNPDFIQHWVRDNLKSNRHRLQLVMSPDDRHEEKVKVAEQRKLESHLNKLSDQDRQEVYSRGLELAEVQSRKEDLSCLPTLRVSDLDPNTKRTAVEHSVAHGVPIQSCVQPTNGVTYFRALLDTSHVSDDLLPYLSLFVNILTKMGAGGLDYVEQSQQVDLTTGGLGVSSHVNAHHSSHSKYQQGILLSSYCLDKNIDAMLELWTQVFQALDLSDVKRLETLVKMSAADLATSLSNSGHAYAMTHAQSHLHPSAHVREKLEGIEQVKLMKRIAEMTNFTYMQKIMDKVQHEVLSKRRLRLAVNAGTDVMDQVRNKLDRFVADIPGEVESGDPLYVQKPEFKSTPRKIHYQLPFAVNFCAKATNTHVSYTHEDFPRLRLLARLMSAKFLHREIREKGGAYGSGASLGGNGLFTYYSYRDPNSLKTLCTFEEAVEWAMRGGFDANDVDEAKLSVFQQMDHPVAPGDRGMTLFLSGITDDLRQTSRDRMFDVTREQLVDTAAKYLTVDNCAQCTTFLGPENVDVLNLSTHGSTDPWVVKRPDYH